MGLIAKGDTERTYDPIPADVHHAICIGVYDLGSHYSQKYNKTTRKCLLMWELPDVRIDVQKEGLTVSVPRLISKQYTLSLGEKSILYKDLVSWRGRKFSEHEMMGFDLKTLLGVNCMLQVIHTVKDGKTYANISSVLPIYKGVPSRKPDSDIMFFSLEEDSSIPENVPKWIAEIITASNEWGSMPKTTSHAVNTTNEDDVPF
jgi:hypothetical protein